MLNIKNSLKRTTNTEIPPRGRFLTLYCKQIVAFFTTNDTYWGNAALPFVCETVKKINKFRKKMREKKTMENRKDNKDVCAAAGKVAEKIG